jgi:hypothetical protein
MQTSAAGFTLENSGDGFVLRTNNATVGIWIDGGEVSESDLESAFKRAAARSEEATTFESVIRLYSVMAGILMGF